MSEPKDYSQSVIYCIKSLDPEIKEQYIGSARDFQLRLQGHHTTCTNANSRDYNIPVYIFIRAHGGWPAWEMVTIEPFPCTSKLELHTRERFHIESQCPSLNRQVPLRTMVEWVADNKQMLVEKWRAYNMEHRAEKHEYNQEYYAANRSAILSHYNQRMTCACGAEYGLSHKSRHQKSKLHKAAMASLSDCHSTATRSISGKGQTSNSQPR